MVGVTEAAPGDSVVIEYLHFGINETLTIDFVDPTPASPPSPPPPPGPPRGSWAFATTQEPLGWTSGMTAEISWLAPDPAPAFPITHYQVELLAGRDVVRRVLVAGERSVTLTLRTREHPADALTYRVRALNGSGWGAWSTPTTVIDVVDPPELTARFLQGDRFGQAARIEATALITGSTGNAEPVSVEISAVDAVTGEVISACAPDRVFDNLRWNGTYRPTTCTLEDEDGDLTGREVTVQARSTYLTRHDLTVLARTAPAERTGRLLADPGSVDPVNLRLVGSAERLGVAIAWRPAEVDPADVLAGYRADVVSTDTGESIGSCSTQRLPGCVVRGIDAADAYSVIVTVTTQAGMASTSEPVTIIPADFAPEPIEVLGWNFDRDRYAEVMWRLPEDSGPAAEERQEFQYRAAAGTPWQSIERALRLPREVLGRWVFGAPTRLVFQGGIPVQWSLRVRTVNAVGKSPWTILTPYERTPEPHIDVATTVGGATITWAACPIVDSFIRYRFRPRGERGWTIGRTECGSTTDLSPLVPGAYELRAKVISPIGASARIDREFDVWARPSAPRDVDVSYHHGDGNGSVHMTWNSESTKPGRAPGSVDRIRLLMCDEEYTAIDGISEWPAGTRHEVHMPAPDCLQVDDRITLWVRTHSGSDVSPRRGDGVWVEEWRPPAPEESFVAGEYDLRTIDSRALLFGLPEEPPESADIAEWTYSMEFALRPNRRPWKTIAEARVVQESLPSSEGVNISRRDWGPSESGFFLRDDRIWDYSFTSQLLRPDGWSRVRTRYLPQRRWLSGRPVTDVGWFGVEVERSPLRSLEVRASARVIIDGRTGSGENIRRAGTWARLTTTLHECSNSEPCQRIGYGGW